MWIRKYLRYLCVQVSPKVHILRGRDFELLVPLHSLYCSGEDKESQESDNLDFVIISLGSSPVLDSHGIFFCESSACLFLFVFKPILKAGDEIDEPSERERLRTVLKRLGKLRCMREVRPQRQKLHLPGASVSVFLLLAPISPSPLQTWFCVIFQHQSNF